MQGHISRGLVSSAYGDIFAVPSARVRMGRPTNCASRAFFFGSLHKSFELLVSLRYQHPPFRSCMPTVEDGWGMRTRIFCHSGDGTLIGRRALAGGVFGMAIFILHLLYSDAFFFLLKPPKSSALPQKPTCPSTLSPILARPSSESSFR